MEEIWRDCKGYEEKYQVSNLGRVWSVKRQNYLTPHIHTKGYLQVTMMAKNGKRKQEFIHRLVALAFIDNPNNLPQVNHKDENKTNNTVENLEWMTCKDNINYGSHNERVSNSNKQPVRCIELDKVFESKTQASNETNISIASISRVCSGKQKTAGGYHWEVIKDD